MDLATRRIVSWATSRRLEKGFVISAMRRALAVRRPQAGLIHHSDRGSQYASGEFRDLLARHGVRSSMSGRGNCYDNAAMESFFGSMKVEWTHGRRYETRAEAERDVFEYIEVFYNRSRLHSSLGYVSPVAFEAQCVSP